MAFDWTKVEGYDENMTADQKLALLDNLPEPDADKPEDNPTPAPTPAPKPIPNGYISKSQFDKVSSELASVKKQLKSRMTDEEAKEAERAAAQQEMEEELKSLRKEKMLNGYKASYLAQGYDADIADEAAAAMADGDMDTVFALMKKQSTLNEKNLRAKILKETPVPPPSDQVTDEAKKKKEMLDLRKAFGLSV